MAGGRPGAGDGLTVRALHRHDRLGLLSPSSRTEADLLRSHLAVLDERIRTSIDLRLRLRTILHALDASVEPSTTQFLRLREETITMTQPLTAEQFAHLDAERDKRMRQLAPEELAAHSRRCFDEPCHCGQSRLSLSRMCSTT
jgi:DNA-binding transcriptional MerR regulator